MSQAQFSVKADALAIGRLRGDSIPREYQVIGVPGLAVRVEASGTATFYVRYRLKGQPQRRVRIGRASVVSIKDAREKAQDIMRAVENGTDPYLARKEHDAGLTFAELWALRVAKNVELHTKHAGQLRAPAQPLRHEGHRQHEGERRDQRPRGRPAGQHPRQEGAASRQPLEHDAGSDRLDLLVGTGIGNSTSQPIRPGASTASHKHRHDCATSKRASWRSCGTRSARLRGSNRQHVLRFVCCC